MEIRDSARKHGVSDADIRHAVEHALARDELDPDDAEHKTLWIGSDRAGNLLEIIVVVFDDGRELAVHAMRIRSEYRRLLRKGR